MPFYELFIKILEMLFVIERGNNITNILINPEYNGNFVMLVEDSSVESFNIKVAQNNISLKKPKSLAFVQSDILDTGHNYCS